MNGTIICVGGPLHGKRKAHTDVRYMEHYIREPISFRPEPETYYPLAPKTARYDIHKINFGPSTFVTVWRYAGLNEAEFWRAVADLFEGTERPTQEEW